MRRDEIPLSDKYGVNPTIPLCFFCGEPRNEVALLGRLPGDAQAPQHCLIDYHACESCKERFEGGVLFVECAEAPQADRQPPFPSAEGWVYPTGRWCVISPEAVAILLTGDVVSEVIARGKTAVSINGYEKLVSILDDLENDDTKEA